MSFASFGAEAPNSAAVNGRVAQAALAPGAPKLLGIERIKIVFHIQQAAAERTGLHLLGGILAAVSAASVAARWCCPTVSSVMMAALARSAGLRYE